MKAFHELRYACDNDAGIDEWDETIAKVYDEGGLDHLAGWLTVNMEVYPYTEEKNGLGFRKASDKAIPAKDWWGDSWVYRNHDIVLALYRGMLEAMRSLGCERSLTYAIAYTGAFQFINLFPDLESFRSFYTPIRNVLDWMVKNKTRIYEEITK